MSVTIQRGNVAPSKTISSTMKSSSKIKVSNLISLHVVNACIHSILDYVSVSDETIGRIIALTSAMERQKKQSKGFIYKGTFFTVLEVVSTLVNCLLIWPLLEPIKVYFPFHTAYRGSYCLVFLLLASCTSSYSSTNSSSCNTCTTRKCSLSISLSLSLSCTASLIHCMLLTPPSHVNVPHL